jgi:hypothetical protein
MCQRKAIQKRKPLKTKFKSSSPSLPSAKAFHDASFPRVNYSINKLSSNAYSSFFVQKHKNPASAGFLYFPKKLKLDRLF